MKYSYRKTPPIGSLVIVNDTAARNPGGYGRVIRRNRGFLRVDSQEFPGQEVTGWWLPSVLTIKEDT